MDKLIEEAEDAIENGYIEDDFYKQLIHALVERLEQQAKSIDELVEGLNKTMEYAESQFRYFDKTAKHIYTMNFNLANKYKTNKQDKS